MELGKENRLGHVAEKRPSFFFDVAEAVFLSLLPDARQKHKSTFVERGKVYKDAHKHLLPPS